MKIILLSGKMQSGKNTCADILKEILESKQKTVEMVAFANELKKCCEKDFLSLSEYLNNKCSSFINEYGNLLPVEALKEISELKIKCDNWYEDKTPLTRIILQTYGTNIFRARVDENYWVNKFNEKICNLKSDYVIVTDVRFPNEIECVKDFFYDIMSVDDIISIRINRNTGIVNYHPSETALDDYNNFDVVLYNNGTMEDFKNTIQSLTFIKE